MSASVNIYVVYRCTRTTSNIAAKNTANKKEKKHQATKIIEIIGKKKFPHRDSNPVLLGESQLS